MKATKILFIGILIIPLLAKGQTNPPQTDTRMYDIISAVSPDRIEADIKALAGFGTRNTLSDTVSETRGIGAARRPKHGCQPSHVSERFRGPSKKRSSQAYS